MAIDLKKGTEFLKNAAGKANEMGKKAAVAVQTGIQTVSNNAQQQAYEERMKKYAPLFPDQYRNADFNIPNLIHIVDDAVRKGIDVCEGAIGWLSQEKGVEVLNLYDEAITFSGLQFLPAAICDSVYYVDPFNRNCYISIDSYFSHIQQAKLAELQHIAFSLGVKHYWVEMVEMTADSNQLKGSNSLKMKSVNAGLERDANASSSSHSKSLAEGSFAGARKPVRPMLCWFANDNNVKNLINMRCSEGVDNAITTYTIELSNSNAAMMSASTAANIDMAASKMGAKCGFHSQSVRENNRKMIFKLEF
jgi:hypothetical protein